jgi:hypothetical protein
MVDRKEKEPDKKRSEGAAKPRGTNDDDDSEFERGQVFVCRIVGRDAGGYKVLIRSRIPGFFETSSSYKIGEELYLQFDHFDATRAVLHECDETAGRDFSPGVISAAMSATAKGSSECETDLGAAEENAGVNTFQSCKGTDVAKEAVVNFRRKLHCRRATDLIMPPFDDGKIKTMRIGDYDLHWLIGDLENDSKTGCLRASCESRLSRSAMLLYKGKSVGCIYGRKIDPTQKPIEISITLMLDDLESPDTVVSIYDLPEPVVVCMSAVFLGTPLERNDTLTTRQYMDQICEQMSKNKTTAALAFSFKTPMNTCIGLVFEGEYIGAFSVDDQKFLQTIDHMHMLLDGDKEATLDVSVLPMELVTHKTQFGFSLSGYRDR